MAGVELLVIVLAQTALIVFLMWDRRAERHESQAERSTLLQRIQAPDAAVLQHTLAAPMPPSPMPLVYDDDESYHASREDLAEVLERNAT